MHNGFKDHTNGGWVINQVLISAKRDCSGTISNPLTGWSTDFTVRANNITTLEIPEEQGYHGTNVYETIMQKGIKVEANDTISVYCTNIAHVSFDASFVLPIESLGDEYIIQSYDQSHDGSTNSYVYNNETSAFLIVATEDNTEIEITPTVATLGGRPANETFTITMNAGETYHLRSVRTGTQRDLSGTHILAADCKRIAVFNGNTVTCIPIDMGNGYDHVFEQAMPLRSWGKNFVVTSSRNLTAISLRLPQVPTTTKSPEMVFFLSHCKQDSLTSSTWKKPKARATYKPTIPVPSTSTTTQATTRAGWEAWATPRWFG